MEGKGKGGGAIEKGFECERWVWVGVQVMMMKLGGWITQSRRQLDDNVRMKAG